MNQLLPIAEVARDPLVEGAGVTPTNAISQVAPTSEGTRQEGVSTDAKNSSPNRSPQRGQGKPIKITVNLILRAWNSLEDVCRLTGESKTDAVNRAIQLYAFVQKLVQSGYTIKLVSPEGKEKEIHLL